MPYIPNDEELPADNDFTVWRDGQYPFEIIKSLDKGLTKGGDPYWAIEMKLKNDKGDTNVVWDNLVFGYKNKKSMARTKAVFNALGFDTSLGLDAKEPDMIKGKRGFVDIHTEVWEGITKNRVNPWGAYHKEKTMEIEEDVPF